MCRLPREAWTLVRVLDALLMKMGRTAYLLSHAVGRRQASLGTPVPRTPIGMPDQLNKHLNKQKEFIHGLVELLKESLDDMPAELNEQGELTAGLVMLLKKSIASEKKATGEILRLQEDKAKLCHEIDLLKEKNAGWKKLHENSSSSMKMLQALVMEQKEELAKLRIEHPAAVKVRNAAVEQMMKARVEKSRIMDRMKKMAEETRKEMEVVEAMKKQLRLRGELDHLG